MKIVRITPFLVDRCLLVRVYTDEGIVGTGEAGLWAQHPVVHRAIIELEEYFVGKDPGLIEHHFQAVTRNTHFTGPVLSAALSSIDIALWDILGKTVGKPVHQLLGGKVREKVRVFANVVGTTVEEHVERARQAVRDGYTSLRVMPFLPGWETNAPSAYIGTASVIMHAVREAIGYDIDLGIELHRNFGPDESITLAQELASLRILYYEDPVAPESLAALRYVAGKVSIPVAAGERNHSLFQFKELIDNCPLSMIRPDLSLAGGFTQCKKIAAYAEASFIQIFPHLMGSPVNTAAYTQFNASIPNYALMESPFTTLNDIVDMPLTVDGGYVTVPDRPGIGVELREEVLAQFPYRPLRISVPMRADGAVAH